MTSQARTAAFFDVDETLVTITSMTRFLAYHWAVGGHPPDRYEEFRAELRRRRATGEPRQELNRFYYRHFRGCDPESLARTGRNWFASELGPGLFHEPALSALRAHADAGHLTVLVSGSFGVCLEPIAAHIGADLAIGTVPLVAEGRLTGEVGAPVIGPEKAVRARGLMDALGIDPRDCFAYGDHESDLPLLETVGTPVVVGSDPVLMRYADDRGLRRLPGVTEGVPAGV
ncbi:HAD-IB family hydrolase [Streptomyces sp. AM 4-1-1]|uniref:HAD family hydrolase n=1 Tax=Streptomyces sp. AM 4-1-1 TaxID=3028710 RepID=UPI0023B8948C|nr:HAD family hydrolase [Streptomyces sp. AM 4-1-1]WEH34579.1 HAD-IB family hydrolase [Streptomyces sp. AM 4-1-1]